MNTETRSIQIKDLILLEKNPRKITKEQMDKLCLSMKVDPSFLWSRPVLVNDIKGKYFVYAGNQRVRAAKSMKMSEIPCRIEMDIPETVMRERIIKDNKSFGEWDYDILANDWDLEVLLSCGFIPDELLGKGVEDDGETSEEKEKEKDEKKCELCGKKL